MPSPVALFAAAQVPPTVISDGVQRLVNVALAYALVLVSVATVSMALLELLKAVSRARLYFHQWRLQRWLRARNPSAHQVARRADAVYRELMTLAVAGVSNARALLDQPTEKMMGQIQSATSVALDFPGRYPNLYEFITGAPEPKAPPAPAADGTASSPTTDQALWRNFVDRFERAPLEVAAELAAANAAEVAGQPRTTTVADAERAAANSARARLDHFVARRLDAFQTSTEYVWARLNQGVAVFGGAMFLFIMLQGAEPAPVKNLGLALFGGMIAPFAKDIVTALQGVGRSA